MMRRGVGADARESRGRGRQRGRSVGLKVRGREF